MAIDINVLPLYRQDGQDRNDLPGLYLVTPPRRTARGRDADRLILFFTMQGNAPLEEGQTLPLLQRLAQLYYKVPGSITAAMRACADHLNLFLLDRNLRGSSTGRQGTGVLIMAVMRDERLTLAHCGPAHTFVLTSQEAQDLHDPQESRGLGLTRAVAPRYFQLELHPNDLLVMVAQPPPAWMALTLHNVHTQGVDTLRRRLLGQAGDNLSAAIAQVQVGTGKLRVLRPKAPVQMANLRQGQADQAPVSTPAAGQGENGLEQAQGGPEFETGALPETVPETAPEAAPETAPETAPEAGAETASPGQGEAGLAAPPAGGAFHAEETRPKMDFEMDGFQSMPQAREAAGRERALPARETVQETARKVAPAAEPAARPAGAQPGSEGIAAVSGMAVSGAPDGGARHTATGLRSGREREARPEGRKATQPDKESAPRRSLPSFSLAPLFLGLAPVGRFLKRILHLFSVGLAALLRRMLPDESLFNIPASTMIFVAVAVAVIVATTGGAVYFQRGRQIQYEAFFEQARLAAGGTQGQTDPNELRTGWETTLDFLDRAEQFGTSDASRELRLQAQNALDQIDVIQRLDFQPAIVGGLSSQIHVVRMLAGENDLYLLNNNGGSVLRAFRTGRGYEIDLLFECGPNAQIGPLIDITPLPDGNEYDATIAGMDARGNLLYCIPGEKPVSLFPNIPQSSEQGIRAFEIDSGDLYMLDPGNNQVWVYRDMDIEEPPNEFFSANRPDDVQGMIDMAVTGADVFLLHKDGYIVKCTFGGLDVSPTRCEDPAMFNDDRPGRKSGPVILDARFDQLLISSSPEASLYILDPVNQSIYRFGLRLKFIRQFRSLRNTPGTLAPAFTITQNRTAYLVVGNQVYWATLP